MRRAELRAAALPINALRPIDADRHAAALRGNGKAVAWFTM